MDRNCFACQLLRKGVKRLLATPNAWIRNRFLHDYQNASAEKRNRWNAETYYVLKSLASHNDAAAIRKIYDVGYPGLQDADGIWTEASLSGVAAENQNYDALQALADCGVDVSWYGGFLDKYNWMFVIENKDIRMCRIIATAKNKMITEEAAAFIVEFCPDLVPELVRSASNYEKNVWCRVLDVLDNDKAATEEYPHKIYSPQDRIETLVSVLHYDDAIALLKKHSYTIDAPRLWECIFPEVMSDCYSHDYFYSDTLNRARYRLINALLDNNLHPNGKVVENLIYSARRWCPRNGIPHKNFMSTLTDMLNQVFPFYDQALLDVIWWTNNIKLVNHLVLSGPPNMDTDNLLRLMIESSLIGDWPTVIARPIGRIIRYDLWQRFRTEHESYIIDVIDVMKCLHGLGNLAINKQSAKTGMTVLHVLCEGALPQALWMSCVQDLIVALINLGADVTIKDYSQKTAYDYALEKRAPKAVLHLLSHNRN